MNYWIINIGLVFVLCVLFSGIVIPQILLIAFRKNLFDMPDERKIHKAVVPRLGGIAFKPVVFFSIALLLGINMAFGDTEMLAALHKEAKALAFGFCTIMLLYLTGMADDLVGIRYRAKFVIQILCGIMLVAGGFWLDNLQGVFGLYSIPAWLGYPLTILIVVFIINAINLIDGIDGLASGLCCVAMVSYGVTFYIYGEYVYSIMAFAVLGVLLPFFYYNVFGNPQKQKKIFMGDTGSLTVGMVICLLSFKLLVCAPATSDMPNPIILSFAPLLIPCLDVVRVYFHRVRNGKNPFLPDKNHIHHKLLAIGMRQRAAMVTIVSVSTILTFCNIYLSIMAEVNILLLVNVAAWTVVNIWLSKKMNVSKQFSDSNI